MDLCIDCLNDLPWLSPTTGQFPLPGAPGRQHICTAALAYAPPVDVLVTGLKFRRERHCGRVLGELLAIVIAEQVAAGSRQAWPKRK